MATNEYTAAISSFSDAITYERYGHGLLHYYDMIIMIIIVALLKFDTSENEDAVEQQRYFGL